MSNIFLDYNVTTVKPGAGKQLPQSSDKSAPDRFLFDEALYHHVEMIQ
jgi:hypothetical protein